MEQEINTEELMDIFKLHVNSIIDDKNKGSKKEQVLLSAYRNLLNVNKALISRFGETSIGLDEMESMDNIKGLSTIKDNKLTLNIL
jgi:hypothetical protein